MLFGLFGKHERHWSGALPTKTMML